MISLVLVQVRDDLKKENGEASFGELTKIMATKWKEIGEWLWSAAVREPTALPDQTALVGSRSVAPIPLTRGSSRSVAVALVGSLI